MRQEQHNARTENHDRAGRRSFRLHDRRDHDYHGALRRRWTDIPGDHAALALFALLISLINTSQKEDTMTQTSATQPSGEQAADKNAIRPFHVNLLRRWVNG